MIKELFNEQRQHIEHFFEEVHVEDAEKVFEACLQTKGLLILTGVGKSGLIAEKIALTLISTGTKALFLPATNFLHGDVGVVSESDTILLFSKSGETEELLELMPSFERRKAKTIAIVAEENSRLAKACDLYVVLPVEKELCPFDLAPTTSTEVQLLFGDALAIALMKAKGFTLDEYGENHPSGLIGKKILLKVEDLMLKDADIPLCRMEDKLVDRLHELSSKKCGCLVVVDEHKQFLGIFTDGDLRRALQAKGASILESRVGDLMTHSALFTQQGVRAVDAVKLMQKDPKRWIMMLPVLDQKKVVGLLRMHDIVHAGLS
ncbi:MAG: KpsF/GutQ family sugar-phosphate isomerase [Verrucomicrobia bacterium]|nr:KpsF/GutQ family sugar-phosphate isomerase [Verrucomicrobiota bacterium]